MLSSRQDQPTAAQLRCSTPQRPTAAALQNIRTQSSLAVLSPAGVPSACKSLPAFPPPTARRARRITHTGVAQYCIRHEPPVAATLVQSLYLQHGLCSAHFQTGQSFVALHLGYAAVCYLASHPLMYTTTTASPANDCCQAARWCSGAQAGGRVRLHHAHLQAICRHPAGRCRPVAVPICTAATVTAKQQHYIANEQ